MKNRLGLIVLALVFFVLGFAVSAIWFYRAARREADVSAYNLALTFETLSRAYWQMKDVDGAKGAILEGLRRFPDGWQADQLRRTLDRYEKGR